MAASFKPFLIANKRTGLDLALDPWLLPGDAYTTLNNAYLYQGRIQKRLGQQLLATLNNQAYDIDAGQLVWDTDSGGQPVIDPNINTSSPIMGLFEYEDSLGNIQLIAITEQRLFRFVPSLGYFYDMAGDNLWSGGDSDFFHQYTWNSRMWLVNGVDMLHYYDGSHVFQQVIDPNATGANTVTGAALCFAWKDRLILFNTQETVNGVTTRIPQQARWCAVGDTTTWNQADYLAAETQDIIVGGCFMGDQLTIFFNNSVWAFIYTGDSTQPFVWSRIPGIAGGAVGKKAILPFQDQALGISPTRIVGTDGITVYYTDEKIPQFLTLMNPAQLKYCYGALYEQFSQIWLSYPSIASSQYPDSILVFNFDDNSWQTFSFSGSVLGTWRQTYNAGAGTISAGYPQLLAGNRSGQVLQLNTGGTDAGSPITLTIQTGQINPFSKEGRRCWLGWVDLFVGTNLTGTIGVNLYSDGQATPYAIYTGVPLVDGKGADKSFVRIPANVEADYHQIQITHSTSDQLIVHATIPYCKPGARFYG